MTTKSTSSSLSPFHIPREDQDVYLYSLRVALLDHVISHSSSSSSSNTASIPSTLTRSNTTTTASSLARPSIRHSVTTSIRPQEGWTNALLSLADTFKDPSTSSSSSSSSASKSSRFPKEFVKVLDVRMERIAKGSDSKYQDQLLRQTIGAFYGTYAQSSFQKKLKENRQIEEVILMFVTTASAILKKRLGSQGDEWKRELNKQVASFVGVIRDGLKSCGRIPGELVNRLDTYCSKLEEPQLETSQTPQTSVHDRHLSVASTSSSTPYPSYAPSTTSAHPSPALPTSSSASNRNPLDQPPQPPTPINLNEMPFVRTLGEVFGKDETELKRGITNFLRICTEQVTLNNSSLSLASSLTELSV